MATVINNAPPEGLSFFKTQEMGFYLRIKAETIRSRLCRTGSYYGVRPVKLPNRQLVWPVDQVKALVERKD